MGRVIRNQRRGNPKGVLGTAHTSKRIARPQFRNLDYSERQGYIKGVVRELVHDPGRHAPLAKVVFRDPYRYKQSREYFLAVEGMYSGQYIYCGQKAALSVGNVLPLNKIPEGTLISNIEQNVGDKGHLGRATGCYGIVVGHSSDGSKTRVKLPSGSRKTLKGCNRATVGIIAGGGRTDKPILKASTSMYKHRCRRSVWPRIRGVTMNPVEHPNGGGNHQHIGHPSTIGRQSVAGQKCGLIAARRSGRIRGGNKLGKFVLEEKLG